MKVLIRNILINLGALYATHLILPGFYYSGGFRTLFIGTIGLMLINLSVVPLLKVMFLPLNLLTLGLFTWAVNVIGLYLMTTLIPGFKLLPYIYAGIHANGVVLPGVSLTVLEVAILASFLLGLISHFFRWLVSK